MAQHLSLHEQRENVTCRLSDDPETDKRRQCEGDAARGEGDAARGEGDTDRGEGDATRGEGDTNRGEG